ncbi:MAG: rhodanese-like domain-containing protein [Hyphomonas sp.]|uniref:rhodanese-like domain-containing protein n=1 Tax=Hyphomonas sp. TaxID=87 RepID=UPI003527E873
MSLLGKLFGGGKSSVATIDPQTAHDRVRKKELILIDVRTENEWQSGIAKGAHTITLGDSTLVDQVYGLTREDLSRPVAVICRSGARSSRAASQLAAAGFTDVSNVGGGMMAWNLHNLPTQMHRRR